MINSIIGKYKITRLIGEGGMASVYEAEHEMLGTKVAIKVLNPILSANAQIKERFRNEAKLMASLDHPNITKVIDFDEQYQQLSIVMEYLNGEDLNQKIKRKGPLSEKEIMDVFTQTLSAFQYAHEKGIVHRDIKPSNIFILPNGHVKILDFGIAKLFGQGNEMTQTGTQMGTPIYMSPEQVKADKSIDHRSDIYSLGVTMFFAINGKPPYNSDTDSQFDIFNKIVYEPLPEFTRNSNLNELVRKACQKDREIRFQSCEELLQTLKMVASATVESSEREKTILSKRAIEKTLIETNLDENNTIEKNLAKTSVNEKSKPIISNTNRSFNNNIIYYVIGVVLVIIGVVFYLNNNGSTQNEYEKVDQASGITTAKDAASEEKVTLKNDFNLLDQNGNEIDTVRLGTQIWASKNLNVDKFLNGDKIPHAISDKEWILAAKNKQPAWCYFDNNSSHGSKHGKLYNWYAVNDPRGLAPQGWHIPTNNDWHEFVKNFGGFPINIKDVRKIKRWNVLCSGVRCHMFEDGWDGAFLYGIGNHGGWWAYDSYNDDGIIFELNCISSSENTYSQHKGFGYSVRCLKN
jgi:uncharacterized protein (TIGR02145 family)